MVCVVSFVSKVYQFFVCISQGWNDWLNHRSVQRITMTLIFKTQELITVTLCFCSLWNKDNVSAGSITYTQTCCDNSYLPSRCGKIKTGKLIMNIQVKSQELITHPVPAFIAICSRKNSTRKRWRFHLLLLSSVSIHSMIQGQGFCFWQEIP